jgi:signal transduction histidine kinase
MNHPVDNDTRKYMDLAIQAIGLQNEESLDQFQKVIDCILSAISIKLPNHKILISNKTDTSILSKMDISIKSPKDVRLKSDRDIYKKGVEEFEEEEDRVIGGEIIQHDYKHNNGMLTRVIKEPLYHPDGYIVGVVNSSHIMRAPDSDTEIQMRHVQKLEAIGQLAAGIAHEINTPIQYIGDNTVFLRDAVRDVVSVLRDLSVCMSKALQGETLEESYKSMKLKLEPIDLEFLEQEIPKAVAQSLEGIARVTRIVSAMKEFGHPGTNSKEMTDLNRAIDNIVTVSRSEWKFTANLELDLDQTLPPVPCFPGELNQVVLNLVVNAAHAIEEAKASHEPGWMGHILIRTCRIKDEVEISVSDTGTGIPDHVLPRIFEPFFTTKTVGKGTGQGLAISHAVIVERHGGKIQVSSEMGQGTTFLIRLPLVDPITPSKGDGREA